MMVDQRKIKIRKAVIKDAENIAALGKCVWIDTYATEGVYDKLARYIFTELTENKIKETILNKTVLVVSNENCLLGYMVLNREEKNRTEVETLYILPRFQSNGLGRQLINEAQKLTQTPLWLSVWELNTKALRFYKKGGFKENGELYFNLFGDKIRNIVLEQSP